MDAVVSHARRKAVIGFGRRSHSGGIGQAFGCRTCGRIRSLNFPFTAIVAQDEAKLAIVLAAINPRIGGVLLSGSKGIGKTSIVRAVADLLPAQRRALCPYGCDPLGATVCAVCAAEEPSKRKSRSRAAEIVELPANAQIDDVVGTIDLKAALEDGKVSFRPGLLAQANRSAAVRR